MPDSAGEPAGRRAGEQQPGVVSPLAPNAGPKPAGRDVEPSAAATSDDQAKRYDGHDEAWARYLADRSDVAARNAVLMLYHDCVRYTAARISSLLPPEAPPIEDLIQEGMLGLMDALEAFDPALGNKFATYCAPRVRGQILDSLRKWDWVPRLVRAKAAQLKRAMETLEVPPGERPNIEELADVLGMSVPQAERLIQDAETKGVMSLFKKWYETDSNRDVRELDLLLDRSAREPSLRAEREDALRLLTRGLSGPERLLLIGYYFEGQTMREIGQSLDLSESRVSQVHSALIPRLRARMAGREDELS